MTRVITFIFILSYTSILWSNNSIEYLDQYNLVWNTPSNNSSESMPCGGGDIGLNVWVEGDELLFYIARSGTFDENNELLKLGRVRLKLFPSPFSDSDFKQELQLSEGFVQIDANKNGAEVSIKIWVDVFNPSIYVDVESNKSIVAEVHYESWRYADQELRKNESFGNSYKWAPPKGLKKLKDSIWVESDRVFFMHQNKKQSVFDVTVKQQGLDSIKHLLSNPLDSLIFGGALYGNNMKFSGVGEGIYQQTPFKSWIIKSNKPAKKLQAGIYLNTSRSKSIEDWRNQVKVGVNKAITDKKTARSSSANWWNNYWEKSFIRVEANSKNNDSVAWQVGRNYQLFRYMLGCNAFGSYPTKFNGGLFTYDPCFVNSDRCFTPDFRNWGGGTFTAQNQRLVYFPMLKSGDGELMKPQLDFYKNLLNNAELRSEFYWNHSGACFTEQIENFGLPNPSEYGWKRPEWYDRGMQYNAWLEYQWDTSLEICLMILEQHHYFGTDIREYLPLIFSCLEFFDEHYQYLARLRGRKTLDADGKLVLYPGSSCETYKMAYNATSTVAGLRVVTQKLLELPAHFIHDENLAQLEDLFARLPELSYREIEGEILIAPASLWERINNTEAPQLYPVYPWKIFGLGKPRLDTAINTFNLDPDLRKFRGYKSWKQTNIFAARLGMADTAWKYTALKLRDSGRRFPAFWGPGFDWVPDHNWGGSGMIGLQEMLLQEADGVIYLFPAWPKNLDVHFRLHAPGNIVVEAKMEGGTPTIIEVIPKSAIEKIIFK